MERPSVARIVDLVPVALLGALVAVQRRHDRPGTSWSTAGWWGWAVAAVALALRAPFIVVLVLAGAAGASRARPQLS